MKLLPYVVFIVFGALAALSVVKHLEALSFNAYCVGSAVFFGLASIVVPILMMIQSRHDDRGND